VTMTNAKSTEPTRFAQFRNAERAVWDHYGLQPTETLVPVRSGGVIRVNDIGSGDPILFIHGSGGSGVYWAPLVQELASHFRCILMDRPGWTLSSPVDYSNGSFGTIAASMQADLLDALRVDRAHLVGGSIGNLYALRFAQAHPDRVGGIVLAGSGPLTDAIEPPTFIKLLRSPLGQIIIRIPQKPGMVRKQLAGLGHRISLDRGLIPDVLVDLYSSTGRHTEAMRHERDLVRNILDRGGWVDGFTLGTEELGGITVPTLMIYGNQDPVGRVEIWERFVEILGNGALYTVADSGHLNWYDKPQEIAIQITTHLENIHL
jgi:pimeloyl-ACP methyl ester carboxylesterase